MYYIGVDLGTSSLKVLLADESGRVCKSASRNYPLDFPQPGWSQQDPEDWWNALCDSLQEILHGIEPDSVASIAIAGQMHGLVVLDGQNRVIRPAILWNDGRTGAETAWLNTQIGRENLLRMTGNIAFAGFTAPKLLWMKKNEPRLFDAINKIMLPKDYLTYQLTGLHCSDCSDASGTLLLDVKNRCWSDEMLRICDIKTEQLGELFESYMSIGTVLPSVAAKLGLSARTIVAAGAGDNAAAAVGTGTVGNCKCNISLGTSGTVFISSERFLLPQNGALHSFAHADGNFHLMGCILSAASAYHWWAHNILQTASDTNEQMSISEKTLGRNELFFLPYLMGERSPHNDASARGAFIGMTMGTSRAEMTQAVMEGVAFAIRDSVEIAKSLGVSLKEYGLCGGGAKSLLWRKLMANVLNARINVPILEESTGYGAVILAMVAAGKFKNIQEACFALKSECICYNPQPELALLYEERYETFKNLYPALKAIYPLLKRKDCKHEELQSF